MIADDTRFLLGDWECHLGGGAEEEDEEEG